MRVPQLGSGDARSTPRQAVGPTVPARRIAQIGAGPVDTRKPGKCIHKSSNCTAGADSRYLQALLGGGHEQDRNCLRFALPQVARAEPRKDVARILMM